MGQITESLKDVLNIGDVAGVIAIIITGTVFMTAPEARNEAGRSLHPTVLPGRTSATASRRAEIGQI